MFDFVLIYLILFLGVHSLDFIFKHCISCCQIKVKRIWVQGPVFITQWALTLLTVDQGTIFSKVVSSILNLIPGMLLKIADIFYHWLWENSSTFYVVKFELCWSIKIYMYWTKLQVNWYNPALALISPWPTSLRVHQGN